jgi:hypothetical protein
MTLENVFYTLGIVFMLSWLGLFFGLAALGFMAYRKIKSLQVEALEKATSLARMSKSEIGSMVAGAVGTFLMAKARDAFSGKKSRTSDEE